MKYQVVFEIACDVEASSKDEAIDTAWNELEQRMEQLPRLVYDQWRVRRRHRGGYVK